MRELKVPKLDFPRIEVTEEFISKNNLTFKRSSEEIRNRIDDNASIFGFNVEVLINYLTFADGKKYFHESYIQKVESGEVIHQAIDTIEECCQDFLDYMIFAWGKSLDERGVSASRSIEKLTEWLWLLGREDLIKILKDDDNYFPYGSPALIMVCQNLGIEVPEELILFRDNYKSTD